MYFFLIIGMSFKDKSHLVSHISLLQGSRKSSSWEVASLDMGEVRTSSFQEALWASQPANSNAPAMFPPGLVSTISTMTLEEIKKVRKHYCFSNEICVVTPTHRDWVISGLLSYVALYEEFFCVGPHFLIHLFIKNVLSFYQLVPTQLAPNSIRIIISFIVLCHLIRT